MFHFVSAPESLTPELENSITAASAWVQISTTGAAKPDSNAGALVLDSFYDLKKEVAELRRRLEDKTSELRKRLEDETRARANADLILANYIAQTNNLLRDNNILVRRVSRIEDAHSVLYYCQICFDKQRTMRFSPCGHMATCSECTQKIMDSNGTCPLCRTPVTEADRTFT